MKNLIVLLCLIAQTGLAQITGNQKIETRTFNLENVSTVAIDLYAKVTINASGSNIMSITADSNLFPYIGRDINDGILQLDQVEWIRASQDIEITIGLSDLKKVIQGTHDQTFITGLDQKKFSLEAPIGKLSLEGSVEKLELILKGSKVKADQLVAQNAKVVMTSWSKASVNVIDTLETQLSPKAKLELVNSPKLVIGDNPKLATNQPTATGASYIDIKIKNNSWNRNKFVVEGPNPSGSTFSYGFAIMPGLSKQERWTVGTKVYKENRMGKRTLLVTLTQADDGQTIKLFK